MRKLSSEDAAANPHDRGLPPSRLPCGLQWAGMVLFVVGLVASFLFGITEHWRRSAFTLGAAMVHLGLVRLLCDPKVVGVFSVRSRRFDVCFCACAGGALALIALTVDSLGS